MILVLRYRKGKKEPLTSQRRGSESSLPVCCRGVALETKKRAKIREIENEEQNEEQKKGH